MISICLKSSNSNLLNYLEQNLDKITLPQIYYSQKQFKLYKNLIIHYLGTNINDFYNTFSNLLSVFIIEHYENSFIQQQLNFDFFYFSPDEKKEIQKNTINNLNLTSNAKQKRNILNNSIQEYFMQNSTCILEGFINFRLYNYKNFINLILESSINDYIIKKEYSEYINLLSEYISIQEPQSNSIHLIYSDNIKLILDDSKNIITDTSNSQVYLSDISFSNNDFILNALLSLLPQKLYIHLNNTEDNFIKFLKQIFKNRVTLCQNCNICNLYFNTSKICKNNKQ